MVWRCFSVWAVSFFLGCLPLHASENGAGVRPLIEIIRGEAIQGGLMVFRLARGYQVRIDGAPAVMSDEGIFVLGFHRDDTAPVRLDVLTQTGTLAQQHLITPEAREYAVQRIDNLPTAMVSPDEAVITRIQQDRADVVTARASSSDITDALEGGFDWPLSGRITGVYGSQRILNGKPRQPHYGIDIAAATGTPVRSAADGIVTMATSLYFTGGTVIIDHGYHLSTTYSHLDSLSVKTGQTVRRGQIIGGVGSTGRSTGPHLDWRANWGAKRLDPALISNPPDVPLPSPRPSRPTP